MESLVKKKITALITVAVFVFTAAGCGSNSSDTVLTTEITQEESVTDTQKPAAVEQKKPIILKTVSMFGGADPKAPVYSEITEQFEQEFSYITVEDNSQKSDEAWKARLALDFSVGNEPDVFQFFTDANADAIVAMDKFVTVDEIKSVYPEYAKDTLPAAMEAVTNNDGVSRAVPTTGFWEGLYCNKDLFEKYNVTLPTDWTSLVKAIDTFKKNDIIPIACSLNNVPHYWIDFCMLYAAGEESYVQVPASAPEGWVKGLEVITTLRNMGAFPQNTDTVDDNYASNLFINKAAAMKLDGSWFLSGVTDQENTVVIPFPGVEDQKAKAGAMISGMSSGFYITKQAWEDPEKRDAAVKFVMTHTSKEAVQKYWNGNGSAACAVTPIDGMTPLAMSGFDYSNSATSISSATDSRISDEAWKIITGGMVKVSTGDLKAEDLLNEALKINAEKRIMK